MARAKKTAIASADEESSADQKTALKYKEQGRHLRGLRELCGLSSKELGDKIGQTRFIISKFETGRRVPSLELRRALGRILGVEAIAAIDWPRPYAPTNYRRQSKLTPPDSPGAILKQLRLSLPDTPTQREMAERLGMKEENYRWVESRGGRVTPELLKKLATIYSDSDDEQLARLKVLQQANGAGEIMAAASELIDEFVEPQKIIEKK